MTYVVATEDPTPRLWSVDQAARILQKTPNFVRSLQDRGELRVVRYGTRLRMVRDDDLQAWIDRHTEAGS